MAHIITLTNQKGGVGKTTSTATLISGLTANHHKVLGIDLDPQGNLGFSLGIEIENKYLYASDALALAMCHFYQLSSPLATVSGTSSWEKFIAANPERVKD